MNSVILSGLIAIWVVCLVFFIDLKFNHGKIVTKVARKVF